MNKTNLFGTIGLLLAAGSGYATLQGWNFLVSLSQTSDLIVVARASQASQTSTGVGFTLLVSRVVKGDPTLAGTIIPVQWIWRTVDLPILADAGVPAQMTGYGLWFLRASSSGWVLSPWIDPGAAFIPEPTGPILSVYSYAASASLTDKIASEVSNAVEGDTSGEFNFQLVPLHSGLLEQLNSPVVQVLYQRLSVSPSALQRELGVSGLVRSGFGAAIATAAQLAPASTGIGALVISLRNDFRATDANSVAALGKAAADTTNPNTAFREAAANALAAIHTAAAVPYLAALLEDTDAIIRAEGISGLSSFANGLPVQTASNSASMAYLQTSGAAPYKTADTVANSAMGAATISKNEARYLSFWKNWWAQNQGTLGN